jgi:hypothetical protein
MITAKNFLEENTTLIFNIDINELSLADLINSKNARKHLKISERFLRENKFSEALDSVSLAFHWLIHDYLERNTGKYGEIPDLRKRKTLPTCQTKPVCALRLFIDPTFYRQGA